MSILVPRQWLWNAWGSFAGWTLIVSEVFAANVCLPPPWDHASQLLYCVYYASQFAFVSFA